MAADTFSVERSTIIDASAERIYPHIVDFRAWPGWSPWEEIDPNLERSYTGEESGKGARYAWSGNRKAGRGSMEILLADEPSRIEIDLIFDKPFKARNDTVFVLEPLESDEPRTQVTWTMAGTQSGLMKVFGRLFSTDKMIGKDFEKGLAGLKTVSEGRPAGST